MRYFLFYLLSIAAISQDIKGLMGAIEKEYGDSQESFEDLQIDQELFNENLQYFKTLTFEDSSTLKDNKNFCFLSEFAHLDDSCDFNYNDSEIPKVAHNIKNSTLFLSNDESLESLYFESQTMLQDFCAIKKDQKVMDYCSKSLPYFEKLFTAVLEAEYETYEEQVDSQLGENKSIVDQCRGEQEQEFGVSLDAECSNIAIFENLSGSYADNYHGAEVNDSQLRRVNYQVSSNNMKKHFDLFVSCYDKFSQKIVSEGIVNLQDVMSYMSNSTLEVIESEETNFMYVACALNIYFLNNAMIEEHIRLLQTVDEKQLLLSNCK